jgi:hypothetical protein
MVLGALERSKEPSAKSFTHQSFHFPVAVSKDIQDHFSVILA